MTKINGLSVQTAELYKKLSIGENSKLLRTLLSVTQLLKKYERVPEVILIQNSNVYLSYGAIQVNLGSGTDLNEKILRMDQILPQLDGMSGTLACGNLVGEQIRIFISGTGSWWRSRMMCRLFRKRQMDLRMVVSRIVSSFFEDESRFFIRNMNSENGLLRLIMEFIME